MNIQEKLKSILYYDPKTGGFTHISRSRIGQRAGYIACANLRKPTPYKLRRIYFDGKNHAAARLAYLYMMGKFPDYPCEQMDHINHDSIDNRWKNLRCVTQSINGRNRTLSINNISGFTGVSLCKHNKKWMAHIRINKIFLNLGYFYDKQKAVNARKFAEKKYGFHPNHGYSIKEES